MQTLPYAPAKNSETRETSSKKIVILTDEYGTGTNLGRMLDVFKSVLPAGAEVVDISRVDTRGGCLGCMYCTYDNTCAQKDDVKKVLTEKILPADIVVIAGSIRERFLSSGWKAFWDRCFVLGHTPKYLHKQVGFIISGPLRETFTLRQVLRAFVMGSHVVGTVTDEYHSSEEVTILLKGLAHRLVRAAEQGIQKPPEFTEHAKMLMYRELICEYKGVFRADHLYYKKHRLLRDYPNKNIGNLIFNRFLLVICGIPAIRKQVQKSMTAVALAPLKKQVDGIKD